jgi:hypothetical protein
MKYIIRIALIFSVIQFITNVCNAQNSTNAAGGIATGSGGSVAFSIGQVVYTTIKDTSASISMGVQQTYDITNVGINEVALKISLVAYPNPTSNDLTLVVNEFKNDKLTYQLIDMQGKLLLLGNIAAQQTQVNTTLLASATYFLHVYNQQNQQVQSFKIIKK